MERFQPHGINVNAIAPGHILTDMTWLVGVLMRLRNAVDILMSIPCSGGKGSLKTSQTGQVLTVDGGRTDLLTHSL